MTLSAIFNGDANQLADVRAVSTGYPLRGSLTVADRPFAAGVPTREIPAPGEAWPDSRLAAALGASIGSELNVGSRTLRVTRILISRPDQNSTFVEFASALLINDADLPATKLIQPGSRVKYALLLAGTDAAARCLPALALRRGLRQGAAGRCGRGQPADRRGQPPRGALPGARQPGGGAALRGGHRHERAQLRAAAPGRGGADEDAGRRSAARCWPCICGNCWCWRSSRASSAPPPAGSRSSGWCACCGACCAATCRRPVCGRRWWASSSRWPCWRASRCRRCCS